eukprot:6176987-Ditylum_brightwellii.AAC.1
MEPPRNLCSLLGLGLKFYPTKRFTYSESPITLSCFRKDVKLKTFYAGEEDDLDSYNPKMYLPGKWQPLDWMLPPIILYRLTTFTKQIEPLFAKCYGRNNLLPHHQRALLLLISQSQFLIIQ